MKFPVILMVSALSLLGSWSQAETVPAQGPIPFATYDADADGVVTEAEFNTIHAQRMASRAATGRPMRGAANAPTFAEFDQNADGKLTPAELAAGQQEQRQIAPGAGRGKGAGMGGGGGAGVGMNPPAFSDVDANGDGCINAAEFAAGWGNRGSGNAAGYQMPGFADFDADQDGYISEQELNTGRAQRIGERAAAGRRMRNLANAAPFADIDTSKDGKIDPAEFAAHQRSERQPAQP